MFISILNISYFILISSHYLGFLNIPDILRLVLAIVFILANIFNLFKKKALRKFKSKDDDDFFVFNDKPFNPSSPNPNAKKFMEDLNKYIRDKEKMKIKR